MKRLKQTICVLLLLCITASVAACAADTKTDVEQLLFLRLLNQLNNDEKSYDELKELFDGDCAAINAAVRDGRYEDLTELDWIESATESDGYVDFYCGGSGMGSQTNYTGFFYTPDDDPLAMWRGAFTANEFVETEDGWEYTESGGDNVFRVRRLAGGYYYYHLHY